MNEHVDPLIKKALDAFANPVLREEKTDLEEWKQEQNSETTVGPCNANGEQQTEPPDGETTVL